MDALWFLWELVITAIESLLIYYLFVKRLERLKRGRLLAIIGALVIFAAISALHAFSVSVPIVMCASVVACIGYAYFCFDGSRVARILLGCMQMLTTVLAYTLTFALATWLNFGDLITAMRPGAVRFYMMITFVLLKAVLVLLAANLGKGKRSEPFQLSVLQVLFLIAILFAAILAIHKQMSIAFSLMHIDGTGVDQQNAIVVSLCILVILNALFFYVYALGRESQKSTEQSLDIQKAKLENEYYRNNEISVSALRELRHDITTHMHVMKSLLDQGKNDELEQYFTSIEEKYSKDNALFLTENTMLNAMLTSKMMLAQNDHIKMRVSYNTNRTIPLSSTDFCSLIGNMVDNAIEANRKITEEKERTIDISVGDKHDMIYIKVKNNSDGIYNMADGELRTTKADAKHGIGIKRIRKIAESAGGFFDVNPRPDVFTATVMLPMTPKGEQP